MGNKRLHKSNHTTTHLEIESGTSLRVTMKPPVNTKLKNLMYTGKTTQTGTPTPPYPSQMQHVPQGWDTTSCGGNWFDDSLTPFLGNATYTKTNNLYRVIANNGTTSTSRVVMPIYLPLGNNYTVIIKVKYVSGLTTDVLSAILLRETTTGGIIYSESSISLLTTNEQIIVLNVNSATTRQELLYLWFYIKSNNVLAENLTVDYYNILTVQDTYTALTMPPYRPYVGLTQTNNLLSANCIAYTNAAAFPSTNTVGQQVKANDTGLLYDWNGSNYQLTKLRSLPDGTADTFSSETGERIITTKELIVTSSTTPYAWYFSQSSTGYSRFYCLDPTNVWSSTRGASTNCRCNIAKASSIYDGYGAFVFERDSDTLVYLTVPSSELSSLDNAGAQAYINAQIAAHGNIVFNYELADYIVTDIAETELTKIKEQTQYQTETNVNTNATPQPIITAEVRKLGNKAYTEVPLQVNGEDFYVNRYNYFDLSTLEIVGPASDDAILTVNSGTSFTFETYSFDGFARQHFISLQAGTYTISKNYTINSGTLGIFGGTVSITYLDGSHTLGLEDDVLTFTLTSIKDVTISFGSGDMNSSIIYYNVKLVNGTSVDDEIFYIKI